MNNQKIARCQIEKIEIVDNFFIFSVFSYERLSKNHNTSSIALRREEISVGISSLRDNSYFS